ncbi:MAG: branched-chain amino acid ABC transporter permease [Coriobacteriia bacterium]|nr:branched-chain amino acid ABC transporter permease [Coriobacteriia bacterium]
MMPSRTVQKVIPVLCAVAIAVIPFMVTDRFTLKILTYAGINTLVVVGLALLFGYAGQISMGQAAFMGIGAYGCAFGVVHLHLPWLVAFLLGGTLAALAGLLLALPSLRLRGHYLAMATLGFGELASLAFTEGASVTGGVNGFAGIPYPSLGPISINSPSGLYWLVWGLAGLAVLFAANMVSLGPGRAMGALRGSEMGAAASGVDLTGVKVRAFVASALCAGFAGALYASFVGFVSPSVFTLQASVAFLAMAVIGGSGSLAGPVVATVFLTLIQYVDAFIPGIPDNIASVLQVAQPDVYGLAIVLVVLFVPGGIGAIWRRRAREGER